MSYKKKYKISFIHGIQRIINVNKIALNDNVNILRI